jgi:hypothetical protein
MLLILLLYSLAGMYADTQQAEKAQECYSEAFDRLLPDRMDGTAPDELSFVSFWIFIWGVQFLQQEDLKLHDSFISRDLK